jgi:hypothetical protein
MYKLYCDANCFNKEYSIKCSIVEIGFNEGLINTKNKNRIRLIAYSADCKEYRVDNTGYRFSIKTI